MVRPIYNILFIYSLDSLTTDISSNFFYFIHIFSSRLSGHWIDWCPEHLRGQAELHPPADGRGAAHGQRLPAQGAAGFRSQRVLCAPPDVHLPVYLTASRVHYLHARHLVHRTQARGEDQRGLRKWLPGAGTDGGRRAEEGVGGPS